MTLRKRLGLIVNPIAGMGGGVGLKGTDSAATLERARELGATPRSGERALVALSIVAERLGETIDLVTAPGNMGEAIAIAAGYKPSIVGDEVTSETGPEETRRAATAMLDTGVDLLLFAGGDGTARDICGVIGSEIVALGIPTGVKMHSAVYATNPRSAGDAAARFLSIAGPRVREAEVMDIDEDRFRSGSVSARLYGSMLVPDLPRLVQNLKSGSSGSDTAALAGIADDIIERMADGALYIIGPGTTTREIVTRLGNGAKKTLLGVDLYCRGEAVAFDVTERQILDHLDGVPARIIVTPIGGQGFLFGRGNQQLSAKVINAVGAENIIVVATMDKIAGLRGEPFLVDTGDATTDQSLSGYIRVVTSYRTETVYQIA